MELPNPLPDRIVPLIVQLHTECSIGGLDDHALLLEHLEQARRPAAQHHHTLRVCLSVEVAARRSDVPDDDARHLEGTTRTPHILPCPIEGLADHLHLRLPRGRLDVVTVAVARVVAALMRATGLVPVHVRQDDEVFGLLTRLAASSLQSAQDKVHRLLEVCAGALGQTTVDARHTSEDVTLWELVEGGRGVKGQERVLKLLGGHLGDEQAESHAHPVGSVAIGPRRLHGAAEVTHGNTAAETTPLLRILDHLVPDADDRILLLCGHGRRSGAHVLVIVVVIATANAAHAIDHLLDEFVGEDGLRAVHLRLAPRSLGKVLLEVPLAG
jgi:rhodanese-related sulfurtransferase